MNRRYENHGWDHFNRPKHGNKLVMQQPIKRIASDPQCLKLVTSARASVVSCLNIIGRKVARFDIFSADGFIRGSRCCAQGLWRCRPFHKTGFSEPWNGGHRPPSCPRISRGWFCRRSTWLLADSSHSNLVKCTPLDSLRCSVYSGCTRFRAIRAASKKLKQEEWRKVWFHSVYHLLDYCSLYKFL